MQIVYALYLVLFGWVAAHTLASIGIFVALSAGLLTLLFGKYLTAWTETHFPELHHTPGFRTKTPWRMAVAVTVILLALTHISNYLVQIEAKTLQYQTGQTKIFLTIHDNEDNRADDHRPSDQPTQPGNDKSGSQPQTFMAEKTTVTNRLTFTPNIQIILNWLVETYRQLTN